MNDGNVMSVSATLFENGAPVPGGSEPADAHTLTGTPTPYEFTVPTGQITNYTALSVRFTFHTVTDLGLKRAGGLAWAESGDARAGRRPSPPMIPPGYYQSISVPGGCAIIDPTRRVLRPAGRTRCPASTGSAAAPRGEEIKIGDGAYLIGDGVTLVFDQTFPNAARIGRGDRRQCGQRIVLNTASHAECGGRDAVHPVRGGRDPGDPDRATTRRRR